MSEVSMIDQAYVPDKRAMRELKAAITDFHTAYENMQINPKDRTLYERYISAKETLCILIREYWETLIEALKIDA